MKPASSSWEDGVLGLEGGKWFSSGLGGGHGGHPLDSAYHGGEPSHHIMADFVGSGLGALVNLLEQRDAGSLFPNLEFPATHNTAVLRAAYVFSYLTCVTRLPEDMS